MPAGANSNIYTHWSGVQDTQYDFLTVQEQGPSNKDPSSQKGLLPNIQRSD